MKLEDFLEPVCLNASCRPTLVRHVLSHLLHLVTTANSDRKSKLSIVEFHRPVAVDLLALYGVTENSKVQRLACHIARFVVTFLVYNNIYLTVVVVSVTLQAIFIEP